MATLHGRCRFSNEQKPLVRAHIIPEAFFRAIGIGKEAPLLFSSVSNFPHPKRAPIGVYDTSILCDHCERQFDKTDAYGAKTLLHTLRGDALQPVGERNNVVAFQAKGINQELLRRFFVATLWRASVSTQPFFARVRLGPRYEALGKQAVSDEPLSTAFGATMACWLNTSGHDASIGFMDPFAERYAGVNVYRFYFGPYIAYIKADQRPFAAPLSYTALGSQPILTIIRRNYSTSKDFAAMIRTANAQHQNSLRARQAAAVRKGS